MIFIYLLALAGAVETFNLDKEANFEIIRGEKIVLEADLGGPIWKVAKYPHEFLNFEDGQFGSVTDKQRFTVSCDDCSKFFIHQVSFVKVQNHGDAGEIPNIIRGNKSKLVSFIIK